ncbi:MAG: DNA repair protein RadA [Syntrophaceticus sp.]|nr:DNA repair protein RadA [Syntrophaceticus sp.]
MGRKKVRYFCAECGYETGKWLGRCPGCGSWNTFCEAPVSKKGAIKASGVSSMERAAPLAECDDSSPAERFPSCSQELDRVLGGGIVPGSVTLLGGAPGIGKSTLLLQLAAYVAETRGLVLYVSGEESRRQVQMRARRLKAASDRLYLFAETNLHNICYTIEELSPVLVIVDSIQTTYHPDMTLHPGSIGQIRECTAEIVRLIKTSGAACFLVGHITKDGALAGPKVLEHMVDVVLSFEGERHQNLRLLRGVKNRFGATDEVAVYAMGGQGLQELENPSELFLAERAVGGPGSVVVAALEGSRTILVEIQGLVCSTAFGSPRRAATGVDYNRMVLVAAVLEKRLGLSLANQDIYVNVVGGLKVIETAVDLGIAAALASSYRNRPVAEDTVILGEVGLTGEVRGVSFMEQRIKEVQRLGFRRILMPVRSLELQDKYENLDFIGVKTVQDALDQLI